MGNSQFTEVGRMSGHPEIPDGSPIIVPNDMLDRYMRYVKKMQGFKFRDMKDALQKDEQRELAHLELTHEAMEQMGLVPEADDFAQDYIKHTISNFVESVIL